MKSSILLVFCMHLLVLQAQEVSINEFMSLNEANVQDEDGDHSDWIELYNAGNTAISLTGWYLSDDVDQPLKWQMGERELAPSSHLLVFASSKDRPGPGELHTNFKIKAEGEPLLLSSPDGSLIHHTIPKALSADMSFGNLFDGSTEEQVAFGQSTPGSSNGDGVVIAITTDNLDFSRPAGFYLEGFDLELMSAGGAEIRFTTDGSVPTANSPLYADPIEVTDRLGEANGISMIPTGAKWEAPRSETEKATVIRAASFEGEFRLTPVQTSTYFISERLQEKYEGLPVISITLDADSLFSQERGIYVEGSTVDGNYNQRGRDWEREMNFEYFDRYHEKQIGQKVGGRIHGNGSRPHPQKTLRLYARGEYGESHIEHPFFEDKDFDRFKRILIRSSSTDFGNTMFKDILCSRLVKDLDMDYMAARVCIVFINGEYWGVHSIRERIDKYYLAQNNGLDPDSLDLLDVYAQAEAGSGQSYYQLLEYLRTHDLASSENYEYVTAQLDIDNFIDYNITQLFLANYDWPQANIRFWKAWSEESKWRYIFYDCDRAMILSDHDFLRNYVLEEEQYNPSPEWTTFFFNSLLRNQEFKEAFVQRFFYLLNTTFRADRMLDELDELEQLYTPLMVDHIDRWSYPSSFNTWAESLSELRGFIIRRPAVMVQQVIEYLGEQYSLYPNPVSSDSRYVTLDMESTADMDVSIDIFNALGQIVHKQALSADLNDVHPRISIDGLDPGVYVVRINYGTLLFSEMLVID